MRHISIILISALFFIPGCNKSERKETLTKHEVVIAGKIDFVNSKTVSINFSDIVRGNATFTQILDSVSGRFNFKFPLYHAQDIMLSYNKKHIRLYIEPSDSLFVGFSAKDSSETSYYTYASLSFSGSNKKMNEEISEYNRFSNVSGFKPNFSNSVTEYLVDLKEQVNKEIKELNEFVSLNNPSSEFINWAKNNILYGNANYLVHYKAYLFYNKLPRNDSLFDLKLFPVNNEESLVASAFGNHLWSYVTDRYFQSDSITLKYLINENYLEAYNRCIADILENEPDGIIRDIMVYKLLSSLIDDSVDDYKTIWDGNKNLITSQLLIAELTERVVRIENEKDYGVTFLNNLSDEENEFLGDVYQEILDESKSKLVYLDIWATWCGPCLAQIPDLVELHNRLDGDNIEVISLCLNSDRSLWKQIVSENNIPGKHFFLDKSQSTLLKNKLKFNGFPTYMIIKDGLIIDNNAASPSTGDKILNELNKNAL